MMDNKPYWHPHKMLEDEEKRLLKIKDLINRISTEWLFVREDDKALVIEALEALLD